MIDREEGRGANLEETGRAGMNGVKTANNFTNWLVMSLGLSGRGVIDSRGSRCGPGGDTRVPRVSEAVPGQVWELIRKAQWRVAMLLKRANQADRNRCLGSWLNRCLPESFGEPQSLIATGLEIRNAGAGDGFWLWVVSIRWSLGTAALQR